MFFFPSSSVNPQLNDSITFYELSLLSSLFSMAILYDYKFIHFYIIGKIIFQVNYKFRPFTNIYRVFDLHIYILIPRFLEKSEFSTK